MLLLSIPALVLQPPGDGYLNYSDFPAYYSAAKLIERHRNADVYKMDVVRRESQAHFHMPDDREVFVAEPPFAMPLVIPLSYLPPQLAHDLCTFGAIAAIAASLLILAEILSLSNRGLLLLVCLTAISGPFVECVRANKPTPILLLGFCIALSFLKRAKVRDAAIATLSCLIKPHEFFAVFGFFTGAKKYTYLLLAAALATLIVGLSTAVFGVDAWINYFSLLARINEHPEIVGIEAMPTLKGQLYRLPLGHSLANQIAVVGFILSILLSGFVARRFSDDRKYWRIGATVGALLGFIFLTHAHAYDLILIIPAVAILIGQARRHQNRVVLYSAWTTVVVFSLPFYIPIHYIYLLSFNAPVNFHFSLLAWLSAVAVRYAHQLGDFPVPRAIQAAPALVQARSADRAMFLIRQF